MLLVQHLIFEEYLEYLLMNTEDLNKKLFDAGRCGSTLGRNLLRSLLVKESSEAKEILARLLDFSFIRNCFEDEDQLLLLEDIKKWIGSVDIGKQYLHIQLLFQVLSKIKILPKSPLIEFSINVALAAGDVSYAERCANTLLEEIKNDAPPSLIITCCDTLGRICSANGNVEMALKYFLDAAEKSKSAGLIFEEWNARTNAIWCFYLKNRHIDALDEIKLAEKLARQYKEKGMLSKTLIDKGNVERLLDNFNNARLSYVEALKNAENDNDIKRQSDALGNLGIIEYLEGNWDSAKDFHRKALKLSRELNDPESIQYDLNNLSSALWENGELETAIQLKEEAIDIAKLRKSTSNIIAYQRVLKKMYVAMGKYAAADEMEEVANLPNTTYLNDSNTNVEYENSFDREYHSLETTVRNLLNNQKVHDAKSLIEQRIFSSPNDLKSRCLYGIILSIIGDEQSARTQFRNIIHSNPGFLDVYYRLFSSYQKTSELHVLFEEYSTQLNNNSYDIGTRIVLALVCANTSKPDEGINHAMQAIKLKPNTETTYRVLAEAQLAKAYSILKMNWEGAWTTFRDFITSILKLLSFDGPQLSQWYAYSATSLHFFSIESYFSNPPIKGMGIEEVQIISIASNYYTIAKQLDKTRNYQSELSDIYNRLISLSNAEELTLVASYFLLDGNNEVALYLLTISIQLDPAHAETFHQYAMLMFNTNNKDSAIKYLDKALSIDPSNETFLQKKIFLNAQINHS